MDRNHVQIYEKMKIKDFHSKFLRNFMMRRNRAQKYEKDSEVHMVCKVAVCDIEKNERDQIKDFFNLLMIQKDIEFFVEYYEENERLLEKFRTQKSPYHLVIIAVSEFDQSGMELAKQIRDMKNREVLIIFIADSLKYMKESFLVQTFQYMKKPILYEDFKDEMVRTYQYICEDEKKIVIKINQGIRHVIFTKNIICVEKEKGKMVMKIITDEEEFNTRGSLSRLDSVLHEIPFLRVNRGCIINLERIVRFDVGSIELNNGKIVEVSRRRLPEFKLKFEEYVEKKIISTHS